jgi:hypothetical protein
LLVFLPWLPHQVIDDRIKKVVKRVISEAYLGARMGRNRPPGMVDGLEGEKV